MRPLAMVAAPKIMAAFGLATEPLKRTEPSEPDTTVVNAPLNRKSTRLNSSHSQISYAVFCLKKKPDLLVLGFTFAVSFLTGILFGLAPALKAVGINISPSLKGGNAPAGTVRFMVGKLSVSVQ